MGYGGALIWTGLAKNLKRKYPGKRIILVYGKKLSDYLFFRKYKDNVVFENNDDIFLVADSLSWLARKPFLKDKNFIAINIDKAPYCEKILKNRLVYRQGGHSIALACRDFGIGDPVLETKMILTGAEKKKAEEILAQAGLKGEKFICFEPNVKKDFTPNKEWSKAYWQELIEKISAFIAREKLNIKLVQVGVAGSEVLDKAIDLTGKTTFRETRGILAKALFFAATEGGLAHLAASIPRKSFILISAMMPKELMAYPANVNFYTEVECKNCGLKIKCPYDLKCMKLITVERVYGEIEKEIRKIFGIKNYSL
jgi:ADP-heptose:LPS heptosyltransferase